MSAFKSDSGPGIAGLVVVGYDGSVQSDAAVDWAAAEASRRRATLLVSSVSDASHSVGSDLRPDSWPGAEQQAARQVAEQGAERARKLFPELATLITTPFRHPAQALIDQSRGSSLLVVGASGRGNLTGTVFGSVAFAVVGHTGCPVVVVRGNSGSQPGPEAPVVVGVDGSESCAAAIDFAGQVAAESGAALCLVHVWHAVPVGGFVAAYWAEVEPPFDQVVGDAQELLSSLTGRLHERHPELIVRTRIVQGHPVTALPAEAAVNAALLVVGARGLGGFAGLMLGSVSRGLLSAAPCPVAVVPGRH